MMNGLPRSRRLTFGGAAIAAATLFAPPASAATVVTETAFAGSNGAVPNGGNLLYSAQTIYGATYGGGASDLGAIFELPGNGTVGAAAIYSFSGTDGGHPNGSLVADARGNLYGTTAIGGALNLGTVFKLAKPSVQGNPWTLTVLHSFTGPDGAHPPVGVTQGPDGSLYGVSYDGGKIPCNAILAYPEGCGTVFKISPAGDFRVLHTFSGAQFDGAGPGTNLALDPQGVLIGTTNKATNSGDGGSLFAISTAGTFANVTEFFPKALQGFPVGNIVRDGAGNIYGTTQLAGGLGSTQQGSGVWEVTGQTHKQVLLKILDGQLSKSGVTRDGAGNLYGTTTGSSMGQGVTNAGTVFALSAAGTLTTYAALGVPNQAPVGGVILDPAGGLWGTSSAGGQICSSNASPGAAGCGTVFKATR
jgi:uncharacterized repeat protein (TIGR03803 family)